MNKAEAEKWLENRGYLGTNFPINIVMEIMVECTQQVREPLIKLLKVARCPNRNCDNDGTLTEVERGLDGWPELYQTECEWCYNRKILTTNHQNQQ
jgi:hypothetical protein